MTKKRTKKKPREWTGFAIQRAEDGAIFGHFFNKEYCPIKALVGGYKMVKVRIVEVVE